MVVAGGSAAAGSTGLIGAVRADQGLASAVSSVDDADRPVGQVATVFALAQESAGRSGQYGTGGRRRGSVPAAVGVLTVAFPHRLGRRGGRPGNPFVLP